MKCVINKTIAILLTSLTFLAQSVSADAPPPPRGTLGEVIPMSPSPVVTPQSLPQPDERGSSPFSLNGQGEGMDYMRFEPYNTFPKELNLWSLEKARFIRSTPVLNPERDAYAYSEVLFIPNIRQTISNLYLVEMPPPPVKVQPHLPSEDIATPPQPQPKPTEYQDRYNPAKTVKYRVSLAQVGFEQVKPFNFKTLTIVDWNASGHRLLIKERSGILHLGLRVTDILIYDKTKGTVTIYPEVQRIIKNYWLTHGNQPNLADLSWEIQPLGWEPMSEGSILLKAWAYDRHEKKFLGLWRYDVDAERTTLLQLTDEPIAVAANGWQATPVPIPPPADQTNWKTRLRLPLQQVSPPNSNKP